MRWAKCAHTYIQQEIVRYSLGYFFSSPICHIQWRIGTSRGSQINSGIIQHSQHVLYKINRYLKRL